MEKKLTVIPPSQVNTAGKQTEKPKCRVAAYCRVSTEQEEQLGSFANQVAYYTEYINSKTDYELAGIFSDEGISGTGIRRRAGFRSMIEACEAGKVDLVITKSISRFARNTRDCLHYTRHLKSLGIPVIFEKEGINTMEAAGELLFTILSSLAQEESRNISENTRWGIQSRFQQGIPHINTNCFMGYDKDENGHLIVNEKQAEIVRRIFREFLEGWQPSESARKLNREGVSGIHGLPRWSSVSILRMLQNEKYKGDLLMQKYYVKDFLTKQLEKNNGRFPQYYIENNHPAIIDRQDWEAVRLELERIEEFKKHHQIRELGSSTSEPLYGKMFCGSCGGRLMKKGGQSKWRCINTSKEKEKICSLQPVEETKIEAYLVCAWDRLVSQRENLLADWDAEIRQGNPLESLRASQMKELTQNSPDWEKASVKKRMLIREVIIDGNGRCEITFMDGICLKSI